MISIVALALGFYAVMVYSSSPTVSNENERIYLHLVDPRNPSQGYVKISDMKPDSFGFFMYPSSYNYSDPANDYQRFLLIRLPTWLGGDKNDLSSYRAFSALDVESHCLVGYKTEEGRQVIEDPCHFEKYRIIDGASYYFGISFTNKPIENALPNLNLGVDDEGYLYVKPPTWTVDKNGLVGDGRHLSKEQELEASRQILADYQNASKTGINIPLELDDHTFLIDVNSGSDYAQVYYTSDNITTSYPQITIRYCNCTGTLSDLYAHEYYDKDLQVWQSGKNAIYVHSRSSGSAPYYVMEFFKNGYEIIFASYTTFNDGMKEVLKNFFNDTDMSQLEQVPVGT